MSGTVQRNFRLPVELAGRLADVAAGRGVDQTSVVRGALERELGNRGGPPLGREPLDEAIGSSGRARASSRAPGLLERTEASNEVEESEPVDFAAVLAGVTGMPRSLLRRDIAQGRVTVDGEVVRELTLPVVPARGLVCWDGRPV